ncbi:MAG TPA: LytR C-terminal domain-containing protein [Gemmatimonadales bacterium]|nr:LytR C-terminal domain-containing protein [Gemmatimonadales bacterium]
MAASQRVGGLLEQSRRALIALVPLLWACRSDRPPPPLRVPGESGPHVTVEVLNAGNTPGLARTATRVLRRAGIDVVSFGNASDRDAESTRIVVRRGGAAAAQPVRAALGVGTIAVQLDSAKLLDVSVFLGADFTPRLDFHP